MSVLDEMYATIDKYTDADPFPDKHHISHCIQAYSQSISGMYPDLTMRYAAKVAMRLGHGKTDEVRDNLRLMLQHANDGNRFDPRGVRDALVATLPFTAQWPDLESWARGRLEAYAKADPNYWSGPMSELAALNLNAGFTR